jgi:putative SOS response-associated peptidase YedK
MCGAGKLTTSPNQISLPFAIHTAPPNFPPRYNIRPTQCVLVVHVNPDTCERHLDALYWGLIPPWRKNRKSATKFINAKSEAVAHEPSYRDAFRKRRCLIVFDGYYEWQADGARKQPYLIQLRDHGLMALAGLWATWKDPASGEVVRSATICTTTASPSLSHIHDRMPVILDVEDWGAWLGEAEAGKAALRDMLRPWRHDAFEVYPVSLRVNSYKNDNATLLEPIVTPRGSRRAKALA